MTSAPPTVSVESSVPTSSSSAPSSTTAGSASPGVPALRVVGLGDSYMTAQNSKGQSFLNLYAEELQKTLGRPVDVTSLARNDGTTANVWENLTSNADYRVTIADADVIVISVGGNDSDPFGIYPKGTCAPNRTLKACLRTYAPHFAANYNAILAAVTALREGKPTAIRVMSADNPFVGWSEAPTPTFGTDFYAQVAEAETAAACAAARKHGAKCVDFLHIFNGKDGLADTAQYLAADHSHPGDLGIKTIVDELIRLGAPELS
jgi:lysophospholipase L1-like esterase